MYNNENYGDLSFNEEDDFDEQNEDYEEYIHLITTGLGAGMLNDPYKPRIMVVDVRKLITVIKTCKKLIKRLNAYRDYILSADFDILSGRDVTIRACINEKHINRNIQKFLRKINKKFDYINCTDNPDENSIILTISIYDVLVEAEMY